MRWARGCPAGGFAFASDAEGAADVDEGGGAGVGKIEKPGGRDRTKEVGRKLGMSREDVLVDELGVVGGVVVLSGGDGVWLVEDCGLWEKGGGLLIGTEVVFV